MMEDEDVDPADVVVSSPFAVPDPPPASADARAAARMHRGEVYARRGLLVGAEAVSLDVVEHDYIAAYLYYCSAVKILVASLKGLLFHNSPSLCLRKKKRTHAPPPPPPPLQMTTTTAVTHHNTHSHVMCSPFFFCVCVFATTAQKRGGRTRRAAHS